MPDKEFRGKLALVTGAGGHGGIGRAVALRLARGGADVVLTDAPATLREPPPGEVEAGWRGIESVAGEIEALGCRAVCFGVDLADRSQIATMITEVNSTFGGVDILVNNARAVIGRDRVPVTDLAEEVWDEFLAINTTAVFLTTKLVGRRMIEAGKEGRIINIASDVSKRAVPNAAAYSASKAAVVGLTQGAALDLARHRITVNAVCPGPVDTNRLSHWEASEAAAQGVPLDVFRSRLRDAAAAATPLGRIAVPADVAALVCFLASQEAAFITGQAYNVNGGLIFH